jgi:hypothetical protein
VTAPSPTPRGVVVELCGLPGAGKTSLARTIGDDPAGPRVTLPTGRVAPEVGAARRVPRKLRLALEDSVRRPGSELSMAHHILRSHQPGPAGVVSRWIQWSTTQALIDRSRSRSGVHLFDEGVLQALWSIALHGDAAATLRALRGSTRTWASPDLVLVLDPPVDVLVRRLRLRRSRHSRVQRLSDDAELRAELVRGRAILAELLVWWQETRPGAPIVRLGDDDRDPDAAARTATEAIEALLRRDSMASSEATQRHHRSSSARP